LQSFGSKAKSKIKKPRLWIKVTLLKIILKFRVDSVPQTDHFRTRRIKYSLNNESALLLTFSDAQISYYVHLVKSFFLGIRNGRNAALDLTIFPIDDGPEGFADRRSWSK